MESLRRYKTSIAKGALNMVTRTSQVTDAKVKAKVAAKSTGSFFKSAGGLVWDKTKAGTGKVVDYVRRHEDGITTIAGIVAVVFLGNVAAAAGRRVMGEQPQNDPGQPA